jgi:hypothetical protein
LICWTVFLSVGSDPAQAQQPSSSANQVVSNSGLRTAPLDTVLNTLPSEEGRDPRYAGGDIPISRKLLPQVSATTVPLARTPNQPPRLEDPLAGWWHFHLARQAALNGDKTTARKEIAAARMADPGRPHYQWWQASQSLRWLDTPTLFQVVPEAIATLRHSVLARGRLTVMTHQALLLASTWFWIVLVAGLYLSRWRHIAHDLGAMIFKNPSHPLRSWLPALLPLLFLVAKPGLLGWLALMSVPLLIQSRGAARGLLAAVWIVTLALVYPAWPALRHAVPTLDPQSEVVLLDKACHLPPSGPLAESLRSKLATQQSPERRNRLGVALGIQEARRGNYDRSDKLFDEVLDRDPRNFAALVGKGNNTYYRGRLDRAAELYLRASTAHPERGEAPFNLAQVYFKKLFVPEATEALESARNLGFRMESLGSASGKNQGYSPVVYPPVADHEMAAAAVDEAGNYENLVSISAWLPLLSSLPWPLFLVVGLPLVVATLLVMWVSHQNDPRDCDNCGMPLCRDCAFIHDGAWLCSGCGETARRSQSDMVLATLFKNKSRSEGMRHIQRVVNLGRVMPGTGHLVSGRFLAGWLRLSLLALGLFLVCGAWTFDPGSQWGTPGLQLPEEVFHPEYLPLPGGNWNGWQDLPFLAGLLCLVTVWVIALTDGNRLRGSIPERTSLVPSGVTGPQPTPVKTEVHQGIGGGLGLH